MIEVIKDKKGWNEQLSFIKDLDVYHTYDYHQISKKADESPILIKYTEGNTVILLPLLIRPIENSQYNDAISVYGYTGILTLNLEEDFDKKNFHKSLNTLLNEKKSFQYSRDFIRFWSIRKNFLKDWAL